MSSSDVAVSFEFLHLPAEAYGHDDGSSRRSSRLDATLKEHETLRSGLLQLVFSNPTTFSDEERDCIFRDVTVFALLSDDFDAADLTRIDHRQDIRFTLDDLGRITVWDHESRDDATLGDLYRAVNDGVYPGTTQLRLFVGIPGGWGDTGSAGGDPWMTLATAALNLATDKLVDMTLGVALSSAFGSGRALLERKNARHQALLWRQQGFVTSGDLHEFIDGRQPWDLSKLAQRIALPHDDTRRLLEKIGYEVAADGDGPRDNRSARRSDVIDGWARSRGNQRY
jgi:hypothetical protein